MNASALFIYVGLPMIFLIVATANPRNLLMKGVCIALAYFSLILINNSIYSSNAVGTAAAGIGEILGKDSSPFGLVFLAISLWGYVLVSYGTRKSPEEDSDSDRF
jgi:hypothetical protein